MALARIPWWTWAGPVLAWVVLLMTPFVGAGGLIVVAGAGLLIAVRGREPGQLLHVGRRRGLKR